jgi:SAM-dependent methyltransferase
MKMTTEKAIQLANEKFPIKGYMTSGSKSGSKVRRSYFNIANTAVRYLQPGDRILDLGSGPCDKTAVLQLLGFNCSAYDDLQDDWHQNPGNKEKIISFARACGINFKLATDYSLPFEKDYFEMVMMHSVIEHLHDSPRELLNNLLERAKPEGLLFITVPNAVNIRKRLAVLFGRTNLTDFEEFYWHPDPWRGHIREYVKDDLVKLAAYLDLEILEIRSCDHMLEDRLSSVSRSVYLFLTSVFRGWKDSWLLVAKKKAGWQPRKTLPQEEFLRIFPNVRKWK